MVTTVRHDDGADDDAYAAAVAASDTVFIMIMVMLTATMAQKRNSAPHIKNCFHHSQGGQ